MNHGLELFRNTGIPYVTVQNPSHSLLKREKRKAKLFYVSTKLDIEIESY